VTDSFTVTARDGAARAGILHTAHGEVRTPAFLPVGTKATVNMHKPGAKTTVTFSKAGTYTFTTKAGEDYPGVNAPTKGEDNTLRLVVTVS